MMSNEELKLLPCPFCGGNAKIIEDYFNQQEFPDYIAIKCDVCFSCSHDFLGWQKNAKERAIEAWNRRA